MTMVSVFPAMISVMVGVIALMAAMKMTVTVVSSSYLCGSCCWVVVPVDRRIQLKVKLRHLTTVMVSHLRMFQYPVSV